MEKTIVQIVVKKLRDLPALSYTAMLHLGEIHLFRTNNFRTQAFYGS